MTIDATGVVVRQWLADFVAETLRTETLEQVVQRLNREIIGRVPELADRDMRRDLETSTRAHALVVLSGLTQDKLDYPVPEQAHAFARTIARRGHDLRLLLRVYHVGQEAVLEYMTEVLEQRRLPPETERATLLRLFDRSIRWISTSIEALTDTYMEERERGLRAALNQRTEIVRALLAGEDLDADQATARLGYRLAQRHLACVLWTDEDSVAGALTADGDPVLPAAPGESEALGRLERVAARLAGAVGNGGVLTVPSGAAALWAWIGVDGDAVPDGSAMSVEPPVRIAVGTPADRISGFRQSHREAVAARHVAERAVRAVPRLLRYPEVEVAYLAGADEAAMRALIDRELGALVRPDAASARLRDTLHAYLRCHRSPDAAAKRLGVHKNTVRYRIQRIEELLGHPIEQRSLRLEIALDCAAIYGV
ncbi:PucR family transcriptional regulator [Nocardia mexicana]|uniref:DNA-binding PucR family transcriptional regulator n=1 Tax=Nocardia mexicana TaxID=279262 RepID=A0A370GTU3_9NOCA|nr:helix-turn-helix domain-containing protein [Nocardia mexicana]RDI47118.1 DNA-binding PucR family transcriptional regulator [Nocardia mexicana]